MLKTKEHESWRVVLEVFEGIEKILGRGKNMPKATEPEKKAAPVKKEAAVDQEALAAYESALTKQDSIDQIFADGKKQEFTKWCVKQVADDLVKDFGVDPKQATGRSNKFVNATIGKLFGEWKKDPAAFSAKLAGAAEESKQ